MDAQITISILAFIAFSIPTVTALWRIFTVREALQALIIENRHRVEMLEQKNDSLIDQQKLFLNGMRETLQHVRDRSLHAEEALEMRLTDVETFLEKTTPYQRRSRKN